MQQINLMSTNRRPRNGWNAAERDQKSTRFGECHDECIQWVCGQSPGLFVWKKMCGHHESVTGGQTVGWTSEWMAGQAHSYANGVYDIKYICHHRVRLWFVTQSPSNHCSERCWSHCGTDMMAFSVKILNCLSLKMWPGQWRRDLSDIFKCVLFKMSVLPISLNYDPDCPISDKSALVQPSLSIVLGFKPLSKPVMVDFTDACNATKTLQVVISCNSCMGMIFTQDYLFMIYIHPCWLINWWVS